MKDYQELRANLITMLEELGGNLDDVFDEEQLFENRVDKNSVEIEKSLLSDERFILKTEK